VPSDTAELLAAEVVTPARPVRRRRSAAGSPPITGTAIQHGTGNDPDGLPALVSRANDRAGNPSATGETAWLTAFFDVAPKICATRRTPPPKRNGQS
jgi:hypothetical protein